MPGTINPRKGVKGCREEDTEDLRVQGPRVQGPRAEDLMVQDQAIRTIRTTVHDPTKSTAQVVGRSSSLDLPSQRQAALVHGVFQKIEKRTMLSEPWENSY